MPYSSEFLSEVKNLVKCKLRELGAFADEELPDYITVMVANKKKRSSMIKDLQLFLGPQTEHFTNWLHDVLRSKTQQKYTNKDVAEENSSSKSIKCAKKEKRRRSSSKTKRTRSRSPLSSPKSSSKETITADVVNVQTDENEFIEESSRSLPVESEQAPEPKSTEQRCVVSTSSLCSKSAQKSSEEFPVVRSVVKVSTSAPPSALFNSSTAVGGMLLKRAMNEARASTTQFQDRPAAIVHAQKRPIEKSETVAKRQKTETVKMREVDEAEVPAKVTRFVVTMDEKSLTLKPSVKSRLGPRVVSPIANTSSDVELLDAREILISKKARVKSPRMQIILGDSFGEDEEEDGGEENEINANDLPPVKGKDDGKMVGKKLDRSNIPSSLQRCKYWPNCRNQEGCQYMHPVDKCKAFPSCRFGDRCLYIHPPCRYGAQCSRPSCPFSHLGLDTTIAPLTPKVVCRYFPLCKLPMGSCPFYHPPTPVCRFGAACLNRATSCPFAHPVPAAGVKVSSTAPAPTNKLKWVAPGKLATTTKQQSTASRNNISANTNTISIPAQSVSTEIFS